MYLLFMVSVCCSCLPVGRAVNPGMRGRVANLLLILAHTCHWGDCLEYASSFCPFFSTAMFPIPHTNPRYPYNPIPPSTCNIVLQRNKKRLPMPILTHTCHFGDCSICILLLCFLFLQIARPCNILLGKKKGSHNPCSRLMPLAGFGGLE